MSERAYLLLGPETGAKEQVLKDIRDKLKEAHGGEIELSRFYPFETENGEILTALNNNSLFSDHRMVILSQAEQLGSSMVESIANYLAHPVETATLIIISSELYLSQKIMKAIPKRNIQTFYDLLENQKTDWIRNFFRKLGISITADGIDLLIDLTEDNTPETKHAIPGQYSWQWGQHKFHSLGEWLALAVQETLLSPGVHLPGR